jgi:DNA-directed RNA polymerase subunit RPC12/RpoP
LIRLKEFNIEYELIVRLDIWLAKLKGAQRKGIRPARFAADEMIKYDIANELFALAAIKIKILQTNYEVYCPDCSHELVNVYHDLDDIPEEIRCAECNKKFNPYDFDEYIEITFDLLVGPDSDNNISQSNKKLNTNIFGAISSIKKGNRRTSLTAQ